MAYQAIRWDNVGGGGTIADAARIMDSAGQSVNGIFDRLSSVLKDRQATQDANYQTQRTNNTLDDRTALMQYTDAGAFQDALKSGAIANIVNRHGADADRGALLDFADSRLPLLQQRGVQDINYKNTVLADKVSPYMDAYKAAKQAKDEAGAAAALAQVRALGGKNVGDLLEAGHNIDRRFITEGQADESHRWEGDKTAGQIQRWKDETMVGLKQAAASQTQAAASMIQARTGQQQFGMTILDHLTDREAKANESLFKSYESDPKSAAGQEAIGTWLKQFPENERLNRSQAINTIIDSHPDLTTGAAMNLVGKMGASPWWMPNILARAGAYMDASDAEKSTSNIQQGQAAAMRQAEAANVLKAIKNRREKAEQGDFSFLPIFNGSKGNPLNTVTNPTAPGTPAEAAALIAQGAAKTRAAEAAYESQKPVGYTPPPPAAASVAPNAPSQEAVNASITLKRLQAKNPQSLSIEDRRQMKIAEDVLKEELLRSAQVQAPTQPDVPIDPRILSNAIERASMSQVGNNSPYNDLFTRARYSQ